MMIPQNLKIAAVLSLTFFFFSGSGSAVTVLGTGSGALLGNDLTDLGDDGTEGGYSSTTLSGFDAVFFANDEPGFGGGEYAFNVFDGDVGGGNDKWCCGTSSVGFPTIVGAMLQNTLPIRLTHFTLTSSNDTNARDPRVFEIQGSLNTTDGFDGDWTTIYARADAANSPWGNTNNTRRNEVQLYESEIGPNLGANGIDFASAGWFTSFRLVTDATGATSGAYHALNEIEFFGIIPEPSRALLLGLGFLGLILRRHQRG